MNQKKSVMLLWLETNVVKTWQNWRERHFFWRSEKDKLKMKKKSATTCYICVILIVANDFAELLHINCRVPWQVTKVTKRIKNRTLSVRFIIKGRLHEMKIILFIKEYKTDPTHETPVIQILLKSRSVVVVAHEHLIESRMQPGIPVHSALNDMWWN